METAIRSATTADRWVTFHPSAMITLEAEEEAVVMATATRSATIVESSATSQRTVTPKETEEVEVATKRTFNATSARATVISLETAINQMMKETITERIMMMLSATSATRKVIWPEIATSQNLMIFATTAMKRVTGLKNAPTDFLIV